MVIFHSYVTNYQRVPDEIASEDLPARCGERLRSSPQSGLIFLQSLVVGVNPPENIHPKKNAWYTAYSTNNKNSHCDMSKEKCQSPCLKRLQMITILNPGRRSPSIFHIKVTMMLCGFNMLKNQSTQGQSTGQIIKNHHPKMDWLVVFRHPSEKSWSESQLGWWHSQYDGTVIKFHGSIIDYYIYPIISHYIPLYPIISHYIPLYPIKNTIISH